MPFLLSLLLLVPSVSAAEWDRFINDIDLFDEVLIDDNQHLSDQEDDMAIEESEELFPILQGEQIEEEEENPLSTTHLVIKVSGVPVVLDDVPVSEWFSPYVRDVADRGLISGYRDISGRPSGTFGPGDSVTIEQLAKMAIIAGDVDEFNCGEEMKNESAVGSWSERYVRCAEFQRWAVFSDGSVDVLRPATRAEVIVTVLQAFRVRIGPRSGTVFEDVDTSTEFGSAVETAAADNIVSGYADQNGTPTGFFGPEDPVNRGAIAKIFSLAYQVYGN